MTYNTKDTAVILHFIAAAAKFIPAEDCEPEGAKLRFCDGILECRGLKIARITDDGIETCYSYGVSSQEHIRTVSRMLTAASIPYRAGVPF